MTTIVPYAARAVVPSARFMYNMRLRKYQKAGAAIANFAYKRTRRGIRRAAKRYASRAITSWKRKAIMAIGQRVGSGGCKRFSAKDGIESLDTRTLYVVNPTQIPKGDSIDNRDRDLVNLRGFKICWEVRNNGQRRPIYLNMAVIVPKRLSTFSVNRQLDFFRGTGESRGINFSDNLSSNDFHCRPLNKDIMDILWHKRWTIGTVDESQSVTDYNNGVRASYFNYDRYTTIKRQVQHDSSQPDSPVTHPVIVYWCDFFATTEGTPPTLDVIQANLRVTTYFREPKN